MHAIPKKQLRPTNGNGVILDIDWFTEDPGDDRDVMPVLVDSILLPVPSVSAVTPDMVRDAIAKRLPEVEIELGVSANPPAATRAMLGKAIDASAIVAERQAVKRG
jgi:hypothetical protein